MSPISNNFIGGIKAQAAQAGPDAKIQYKYAVGEDGKLFVDSAKISSVVEKAATATAAPSKPTLSKENSLPQNNLGLSPTDLAEIFGLNSNESIVQSRLQSIDAGVRTHEAQHFRAAGGLAQGTAEYEYIEGPDGKLYAVAGQVEVRTTSGGTPEQQARDAAGIYNAATAPGDASAQDLAVARSAISAAAEAYSKAIKASAEI